MDTQPTTGTTGPQTSAADAMLRGLLADVAVAFAVDLARVYRARYRRAPRADLCAWLVSRLLAAGPDEPLDAGAWAAALRDDERRAALAVAVRPADAPPA